MNKWRHAAVEGSSYKFFTKNRQFSSAYALNFNLLGRFSMESARKAAYDLVHAFPIRPVHPEFSDLSLPERVFLLRNDGLCNVDIARKLGITKQAVGRATKKLRELETIRDNEFRVYWDTYEAFTLDGRSSRFLADVASMRAQGATTAQIAHELHYFKYTIKAVCRQLDAHSSVNGLHGSRRG